MDGTHGGGIREGDAADLPTASTGRVALIVDAEHYRYVVEEGIARAQVSVDIMTADFKAMLMPRPGRRRADSVVSLLGRLATAGVEVRLLHAGVPSAPALQELRQGLPTGLTIRRCPRLHAKAVIIDCRALYLGSANLTGAGLGAKDAGRRNFELGVWTESTALLDSVLAQFNLLWEGQRCRDCRRRRECPVPLEEPQLG